MKNEKSCLRDCVKGQGKIPLLSGIINSARNITEFIILSVGLLRWLYAWFLYPRPKGRGNSRKKAFSNIYELPRPSGRGSARTEK